MLGDLDLICRYICEKSDWTATNLQLQKILYMAQMISLGRTGGRLVDTVFEAWDYGPVSPKLYQKLKSFGASPVEDVFEASKMLAADDARRKLLDEVCRELLPASAASLVHLTHWSGGAWAKHYRAGVKGVGIPDSDIRQEYFDRLAAGRRSDDPPPARAA